MPALCLPRTSLRPVEDGGRISAQLPSAAPGPTGIFEIMENYIARAPRTREWTWDILARAQEPGPALAARE